MVRVVRWSAVLFTSTFEARAFCHEFIKGLLPTESFLDLDLRCTPRLLRAELAHGSEHIGHLECDARAACALREEGC